MEDTHLFRDAELASDVWMPAMAGERPHAPADDDHLQLGRVVSISGVNIVGLIDSLICRSDGPRPARKGDIVKLTGPCCRVFGMISGLTIPMPDIQGNGELFLAEIELFGEMVEQPGKPQQFRRGVSKHPALGDAIYPASASDVDIIFNFGGSPTITVGAVHQAHSRPAKLSIDGLLGKHFTILGSTGSGKSCAVALLLRRMLEDHRQAHVLMLDLHGEYAQAFPTLSEVISPSSMELPFWLYSGQEFCEIVRAGREDGAHIDDAIMLLKELIPQARRSFAKTINIPDAQVALDSPIPYSLREIVRLIDEHMGKVEKTGPVMAARWLKNRLEALRADSRFAFMFGGLTLRDTMAELVGRLFRLNGDGKPLTVVDLSGVPSEVMNVVLSVLCRLTFDFAHWSRGAHPVLLVCEEAHRYLPANVAAGFEPTKTAVARIAKEGRKYGLSLGIVSQRPSEIDPTILSQCNTAIAFRITNGRDQDIVRSVMTDSAMGLLDFLPSLGTGEAIVGGEAVPVPMRVVLDLLPADERPRSGTAGFAASWSDDGDQNGEPVAAIVDRWRRQSR